MDILFVVRMGIKASHLRRLQFGLNAFMSIWIQLCHYIRIHPETPNGRPKKE
jgi:hypothetical protein